MSGVWVLYVLGYAAYVVTAWDVYKWTHRAMERESRRNHPILWERPGDAQWNRRTHEITASITAIGWPVGLLGCFLWLGLRDDMLATAPWREANR